MNISDIRKQYRNLAGLDDEQIVNALAGNMGLDPERVASDLGVSLNSGFLRKTVGDVATAGVRGVGALADSAVGIARMVPGLGHAIDASGYDDVAESMGQATRQWYSPETLRSMRAADEAVDPNASGMTRFGQKLGGLLSNPRALAATATESVASMGPGIFAAMKYANAARAAGVAPAVIERNALAIASAAEGGVTAGQVAGQIASENPDDFAARYYGLPAGALTGAISFGSGRLLGDAVDTMFTGTGGMRGGLARRVAGGVVSEGLVEEMPQSAQEQMFTNLGTGRDLLYGVPEAAATGLAAGGLMGGVFGGLRKRGELDTPAEPIDPTGSTQTNLLALPAPKALEGEYIDGRIAGALPAPDGIPRLANPYTNWQYGSNDAAPVAPLSLPDYSQTMRVTPEGQAMAPDQFDANDAYNQWAQQQATQQQGAQEAADLQQRYPTMRRTPAEIIRTIGGGTNANTLRFSQLLAKAYLLPTDAALAAIDKLETAAQGGRWVKPSMIPGIEAAINHARNAVTANADINVETPFNEVGGRRWRKDQTQPDMFGGPTVSSEQLPQPAAAAEPTFADQIIAQMEAQRELSAKQSALDRRANATKTRMDLGSRTATAAQQALGERNAAREDVRNVVGAGFGTQHTGTMQAPGTPTQVWHGQGELENLDRTEQQYPWHSVARAISTTLQQAEAAGIDVVRMLKDAVPPNASKAQLTQGEVVQYIRDISAAITSRMAPKDPRVARITGSLENLAQYVAAQPAEGSEAASGEIMADQGEGRGDTKFTEPVGKAKRTPKAKTAAPAAPEVAAEPVGKPLNVEQPSNVPSTPKQNPKQQTSVQPAAKKEVTSEGKREGQDRNAKDQEGTGNAAPQARQPADKRVQGSATRSTESAKGKVNANQAAETPVPQVQEEAQPAQPVQTVGEFLGDPKDPGQAEYWVRRALHGQRANNSDAVDLARAIGEFFNATGKKFDAVVQAIYDTAMDTAVADGVRKLAKEFLSHEDVGLTEADIAAAKAAAAKRRANRDYDNDLQKKRLAREAAYDQQMQDEKAEEAEDKLNNWNFSRTRPTSADNRTTVQRVKDALRSWFLSPELVASRLTIVQKWEDLPQAIRDRVAQAQKSVEDVLGKVAKKTLARQKFWVTPEGEVIEVPYGMEHEEHAAKLLGVKYEWKPYNPLDRRIINERGWVRAFGDGFQYNPETVTSAQREVMDQWMAYNPRRDKFYHQDVRSEKGFTTQQNPYYGQEFGGFSQTPNDIQAFVVDGKGYMVADNIAAGNEMAVFMHEIGSHIGLMGQEAQIMERVNLWSTAPKGSVERRVYEAMQQRMTAAGETSQVEQVAYAIEEAVKAGVTPKAVRMGMKLSDVKSAQDLVNWAAQYFKAAVDKLFKANTRGFNAQQLVDLAYGAARDAIQNQNAGTPELMAASKAQPDWKLGQVNLFNGGSWVAKNGQRVHNFTVHDQIGEPLGEVAVTLDEAGRPLQIIAISAYQMQNGMGAKVVAQLVAGSAEGLVIPQMMPGSVEFWQKVGVRLDSKSKVWEQGRGYLTKDAFERTKYFVGRDQEGAVAAGAQRGEVPQGDETDLDFSGKGVAFSRSAAEVKSKLEQFAEKHPALGDIIGRFYDLVNQKGASALRGMKFMSQIVKEYAGLFESEDKRNWLKEHWEAVQARGSDAEKRLFASGVVSDKINDYIKSSKGNGKPLFTLMMDSTMQEIFPNKAFDSKENEHLTVKSDAEATQKNRRAYESLRARYYSKEVGDKGRAAYDAALENSTKSWEERGELLQGLIERIYNKLLRNQGMTDQQMKEANAWYGAKRSERQVGDEHTPSYKAWLGTLSASQRKLMREWNEAHNDVGKRLATLKGPYFPLMRFGKYMVTYKSAAYKAKEAEIATLRSQYEAVRDDDTVTDHEAHTEAIKAARKAVKKAETELNAMKGLEQDYVHERYESKYAAMKAAQRLGVELSMSADNVHETSGVNKLFMERLEQALGTELGNEDANKVKELMGQLWLEMLPDTSALKNQIRRMKVAGATADMHRAFAANSVRSAYHLASLKYNDTIMDTLAHMRDFTSAEQREVYNEVARRFIAGMNMAQVETIGDVERALTSTAFVYMLGASPAFLLTNASQSWMISMPMMAARYGYDDANRALGKAVLEVGNALRGIPFGAKEIDPYKLSTNKREQEMLLKLLEKKLLDFTIGNEVRDVGEGNSRAMNRLMHWVGVLPQRVEVMNRAGTALATYRLAVKTVGHAAAMDAAIKMVEDTHFNYSHENAPYWLKPGVIPGSRVLFQFRKYQLGLIHLLANQIATMKNGSKEERKYARRALLGMGTMSFVFAGAMGVPGAALAMTAAQVIGSTMGDDDEPWDAELEFRKFLATAFGKEGGAIMAKGAPMLAGIDASLKMGAGGAFSILPFLDLKPGKTATDTYKEMLLQLAGPSVGGLGTRFARGVDYASQGDMMKATENFLPKMFGDFVKAYRYSEEGLTTKAGKEAIGPDGFGFGDILAQAAGYSPRKVSEHYDVDNSVGNRKLALDKRVQQIKRMYAEGETDAAMAALRSYNNARMAAGEKAVPMSDLLRYKAQVAKDRAKRNDSGVLVTKGNRQMVENNDYAWVQ